MHLGYDLTTLRTTLIDMMRTTPFTTLSCILFNVESTQKVQYKLFKTLKPWLDMNVE